MNSNELSGGSGGSSAAEPRATRDGSERSMILAREPVKAENRSVGDSLLQRVLETSWRPPAETFEASSRLDRSMPTPHRDLAPVCRHSERDPTGRGSAQDIECLRCAFDSRNLRWKNIRAGRLQSSGKSCARFIRHNRNSAPHGVQGGAAWGPEAGPLDGCRAPGGSVSCFYGDFDRLGMTGLFLDAVRLLGDCGDASLPVSDRRHGVAGLLRR